MATALATVAATVMVMMEAGGSGGGSGGGSHRAVAQAVAQAVARAAARAAAWAAAVARRRDGAMAMELEMAMAMAAAMVTVAAMMAVARVGRGRRRRGEHEEVDDGGAVPPPATQNRPQGTPEHSLGHHPWLPSEACQALGEHVLGDLQQNRNCHLCMRARECVAMNASEGLDVCKGWWMFYRQIIPSDAHPRGFDGQRRRCCSPCRCPWPRLKTPVHRRRRRCQASSPAASPAGQCPLQV